MESNIEYIIEVANCHGGDLRYLTSLIDEFKPFFGFNMKFQPLHPEMISTPDYEWYNVYKELYFNNDEWRSILLKASETKKVWLDIFDLYGVEILVENSDLVEGIKLQASILYNQEVLDGLSKVNCSDYFLIINISAISLENITERLNYIKKIINAKEVLLEIGFQSYPTELLDCGLNKIKLIKENFSSKIVFADHVDGKSDDALLLPLLACFLGVNMVEKHVMHSSFETKYDYLSAIPFAKFEKLTENVRIYGDMLSSKEFINIKEVEYLQKSIQKPLAKRSLLKGSGISFSDDLSFKRSNKLGLNSYEIRRILQSFYILQSNKAEKDTFKREDFKKAIIATIIAGRLKSSRLKAKAVLNIGSISSIEKCIQSCLNFRESAFTVLATSTTLEDQKLKDYCYSDSVIFHQGDPDDVIQRYLDFTEKYKIDVVIRVTADMPYVSSEIQEILLKSHFESGADYTSAVKSAVGTAPEIINVQALKKVKEYFPNANYSEYMTWYFQNNKEHFKVNLVHLPDNLVRDYRLTLDYKEDLDLFVKIQTFLDENKKEENINNIYSYLDNNPEIANINSHISLSYKTDRDLIEKLDKFTKIQK